MIEFFSLLGSLPSPVWAGAFVVIFAVGAILAPTGKRGGQR